MLYLKNRFEVLQFLLNKTTEAYADEIFDRLQTREFSQEGKNRNGFIDRNQTGIRK